MEQQTVITVISAIFSLGIVYGSLSSRIKSIEGRLNDQKDTRERLTRIEERIEFIYEKLRKIE